MSDSYRAIYDAAINALDISHARDMLQQEFSLVAHEMQRPSVLFKPQIMADGDQWLALLGDNLQVGVSGFGKTPAEAMAAFDQAFWRGQTPAAMLLARAD